MTFEQLYLGFVVGAFGLFAATLIGGSLWTQLRPKD
jgi:hypothetical protein